MKALDALIKRVQEAKEHDLSLSSEDCQLLLDALLTLAAMQENLANNDITINKLRKLVGMVQSSEKLKSSLAQKRAKKSRARPRKSTANKVKPELKHHQLESLTKSDNCPECETGKVYKYEPATLLRIVGQSPFTPEQHVMERLRCNTCGAYFTAELPDEVKADGKNNQKYGYSARSIMGIAKFGMGSPYYRQGSMQDLLGVPVTASTIFDQTEYLANAIYPVFKALTRLAANAKHFNLDDTTHRILDQQPILKKQRHSDKMRLRTGVYTSGLIATTQDNHCIVLFETNIGHAGEFIDSILTDRDKSLPPPLLMSDALPSNRPSAVDVDQCLCNSHARRQFYEVVNHFSIGVEYVLERYSQIWINDEATAIKKLSGADRLAYHQAHSLPIMAEIKRWGSEHLANETVEENSGLGKAINYFIKHYKGLTSFCRLEHAQLDNNAMEAQLKLVVRDRKNAMFHKTLSGASIGDVITSLIATAGQAGINAFDYFNKLQRERDNVVVNPILYLPWNH
jgi:rubredoxin